MTPEQHEAISQLRHEGYAVTIWAPEELGGANPRRVEDRTVEIGWEIIEDLSPRWDIQGTQ